MKTQRLPSYEDNTDLGYDCLLSELPTEAWTFLLEWTGTLFLALGSYLSDRNITFLLERIAIQDREMRLLRHSISADMVSAPVTTIRQNSKQVDCLHD